MLLVLAFFGAALLTPSCAALGDNVTDVDETGRDIYFTTGAGGIKAYSTLTSESEVKTVVSSYESCVGIAYDSIQKQIYWSTNSDEYKIHRANIDGSEIHATVLSTRRFGRLQGLAFDWITGNLYIETRDGNMIVCDTNITRPFPCHLLLTGQDDVEGITLNPIQGTINWTSYSSNGNSVWMAGMDGSNKSKIVTGLKDPRGIAIDYRTSRIYWADRVADKIQSSNLDRSNNVRNVAEVAEAGPTGIALIGDTIFWGGSDGNQLRSSNKEGTDIRVLHIDTNDIRYLTVVPNLELPKNRTNHCEGRNCLGICVLSTDPYKCVN